MIESINPFSPLLEQIEKATKMADNIDNEAIIAADYDFLVMLSGISDKLRNQIINMVHYNEKTNRYRQS